MPYQKYLQILPIKVRLLQVLKELLILQHIHLQVMKCSSNIATSIYAPVAISAGPPVHAEPDWEFISSYLHVVSVG